LNRIGIRREDKNRWERRAPLTPEHVARIVRDDGVPFVVQPGGPIRVYADEAYLAAGATVDEDLSGCALVLAVKEIPLEKLRRDRAYAFFSHTTKGQEANRPLLKRLLDFGCTLIDYEKGVDDEGRRLFFFGRQAGLVGALETLRALARRLEALGHRTPLLDLGPTSGYRDLDEIRGVLRGIGDRVREEGLPAEIGPAVFGLTGDGNVSHGAREILELLPTRAVAPADLAGLERSGDPVREIPIVVFREPDMVRPVDPAKPFDLQEYYDHPDRYEPILEPHLRRLTVLLHCSYWEPPYPRVLTRDHVRRWWAEEAEPRLLVVGDLSCDIGGGVEINSRVTEPDDPVYVVDPETGRATHGVEGRGPVVLPIDNLPCLLPRSSSETFGDALLPFVAGLARTDFAAPSADASGMPGPFRRAIIAWRGELEPKYRHLEALL
jgi:hypothetical protein